MCILKNLEKITFKEKWVLNVTTAKLIFVVHRKKKECKVQECSICSKEKSTPECTAAELYGNFTEDFSRSRAALPLEFCQAPENIRCLRKTQQGEG